LLPPKPNERSSRVAPHARVSRARSAPARAVDVLAAQVPERAAGDRVDREQRLDDARRAERVAGPALVELHGTAADDCGDRRTFGRIVRGRATGMLT
jgi:hypothetical protein